MQPLLALFVTNIAEMSLDRGNARFVLACILPVLGAAVVLAALSRVFWLARGTFVLLEYARLESPGLLAGARVVGSRLARIPLVLLSWSAARSR